MTPSNLLNSIRRPVLFGISSGCITLLPVTAHAETDACSLVSTAQVGAAVSAAVNAGTHVTPTFVKTCTWTPAGKSQISSVTLNLQTAAFYEGAKGQAKMATAAAGKSEVKPASVGDDAYYFVAGDQVALFVKKGGVSFKVAVYAKLPVAEKETMELKLAREVVAKL